MPGIDEEKSVSFGSSFECPNISSTTTTSPPKQDGESSPFQGFVKVDSGPTSSFLFGGPPKDSLSFGSRELSPNSSPFGPSPFEGDAKIGWDPSFSSPSPFGGPSFGSRELAPSSSPFGRSPFQGDAKIDSDPTSFSLFGGSLKDNFTFGSRELSPNSSPFGPSPFQGDAKINCDPTFPSPFGSSLKNSFSFGSSQSFPNFSQFSPSPFQGDTKIHRGCTSSSIFGLTPNDSFTFGSRELSPNYSLFSSTTLQKDTKFKCGTTSSPVFGCRPRDGSTRKFSKFSPFSPNPFHRENKFISGCFCPKTSFTNLQHDPAAFHFCPQNLKCFSNIPSPPTPIFHQPPQLAEKRFDVGEKCCLCGPKWPRQGKAYAATPAPDSESLQSISAMPFFQHKSHEELRFEDHQFQGNCYNKRKTLDPWANLFPLVNNVPVFVLPFSFPSPSQGISPSFTYQNYFNFPKEHPHSSGIESHMSPSPVVGPFSFSRDHPPGYALQFHCPVYHLPLPCHTNQWST